MDNNSRRILLVENDEAAYLVVRELLLSIPAAEFELRRADSCQAARELLAQQQPDLCLLDFRLSESDGADFMRDGAGETPFILLISHEDFQTADISDDADYLVREHLSAPLLARSIRAATERKQTRAALLHAQQLAQTHAADLKASEERFRRLFQSAEDGILILDARSGQIEDVNPYLCELLGYAPTDFIGRQLWEVGTFRDIAANQEAFRALQEHECIHYDDLPLHSKDGQIVSVEFVSNVYRSGEREVIQCNMRDISAPKRAGATRHLLAAVVESSDDSIVTVDFDKVITSWNRAAEWLYGYSATEALGQNLSMLILPGDWQEMLGKIDRVKQNETVETFETVRLNKDGREMNLEVVMSPVKDGAGQIIGISTIARDITQRKRAEESLLLSEVHYRSLFESNPHPMWVFARETLEFLAVNEAAIIQYGYSREEFLAMTIKDIRPPEDLPVLMVSVATPSLHNGSYGIWQHRKKDGTIIEVEISTHEMAFGARPARLVTASDVTARRAAEKQSRFQAHLLREVGQAVIATDKEGTVIYWNRYAETLYGWSAQDAMGQKIDTLVIPETALVQTEEVMAQLNRAERWSDEVAVKRRDGTIFPASLTNVPLYDESGILSGSIGISQDISERKQAEQALRESEEYLRFVIEISNHGIWEWDAATGKITWSERIYTLLGLPPQHFEMTAESHLALVHPDDIARLEQAIQTHLQSGQPFQVRVRYRHSDGTYLHILSRGAMQRDAQGQPLRMVGSLSDLTGLIRAEEEREAQSREIVAMWESMSDACFNLDTQWRFTRINSRGTQILQKSAQELIGATLWDAFPGINGTNFERQYRRAAEEQVKVDFEDFSRSLQCWLELHAYPSPDGLSVYFHDITERKQAEAAICLSEERFRSLIQATAQIIWIVSPDRQTKEISPTWCDYTGQSAAQSKGWGWLAALHPDDVEATRADWDQSVASKCLFEQECHLRGADGTYRLFAARGVPILDEDGGIREWVGTCTDIHDRRAAEEERDRFFTISLDLLCIADQNGTFKRLNPAFEATLGHSNAEMMAAPFLEWVHADDQEATLAVMKELWAGVPVLKFANRYQCRDGDYRWLSWTAVPFGDSIYAAAHDITSLKSAQTALHQANDELELRVVQRTTELEAANESLRIENIERQMTMETLRQVAQAFQLAKEEADSANAAKSEFLSRMSHELRTPLNAILGFGQILERQKLTPLQLESIGHILKGGNHLLGLVNEILDISRVEAGQSELILEPVALADLVAESCDLVRPLAVERTIRVVDGLRDNSPQNQPRAMMADRQRLKQVLLNLLSNAIKYNREGGKVIVSARETENERIQIRVQDTGTGLTPQNLQKLFTPFERLHATDSTIEGTGLGLVISRRLIEAMGGNLGVESAVGQGSTFWIELPTAEFSSPDSPQAPESQADTPSSAERTSTVLYIEDNASNLQLVESIFEMRPQWTLLSAVQGKIGLDLARDHEPDLILLDLNLPDLHGSEVLARLQQSALTREIPVIVISADAIPKQIEQLLGAGAKAYLTKPLDIQQFLSTLDEFFQAQKAFE